MWPEAGIYPQEQTKNVPFSDVGGPESGSRPVQFNATQEPGDGPPLQANKSAPGSSGLAAKVPGSTTPQLGHSPCGSALHLLLRGWVHRQGARGSQAWRRALAPAVGRFCVSAHVAQGPLEAAPQAEPWRLPPPSSGAALGRLAGRCGPPSGLPSAENFSWWVWR